MNEADLQQVQELVQTVAPNVWAQAGIIAAVGIVIAKLAEWFLFGVIGRVTNRTSTVLDDTVVRLLHRPVFNTFAIFGLMAATYSLAEPLGEQALAVSETAFRAGHVDFESLVDAERLLLEFKLVYERALVDRAQQLAEIEWIVGREFGGAN